MATRRQTVRPPLAPLAIVLLALVVGCAPAGISRERAIVLARASTQAPGDILRAESGRLDRLVDPEHRGGERGDRLVWVIVLEAAEQGECVLAADGQSHCPPVATSKLVVLDRETGAFLFGEAPAP